MNPIIEGWLLIIGSIGAVVFLGVVLPVLLGDRWSGGNGA